MTTADVYTLMSHTGKTVEWLAGRTVRQPNGGLCKSAVNMTWRRRTCREDGLFGRSVVVHGEIAEQSQAVSRQQKTRCGRCRRSTHTIKQCAVITWWHCVVWVFTHRCQCEQSCRGFCDVTINRALFIPGLAGNRCRSSLEL